MRTIYSNATFEVTGTQMATRPVRNGYLPCLKWLQLRTIMDYSYSPFQIRWTTNQQCDSNSSILIANGNIVKSKRNLIFLLWNIICCDYFSAIVSSDRVTFIALSHCRICAFLLVPWEKLQKNAKPTYIDADYGKEGPFFAQSNKSLALLTKICPKSGPYRSEDPLSCCRSLSVRLGM